MIPATVVSPHSINTLDRIAFCKSVREKRKQLQLNHHTNGESIDLFIHITQYKKHFSLFMDYRKG
jgi:hypothetical protein